MSIIEQAAKRLEQLRRSGVDLGTPEAGARNGPETLPRARTPEAAGAATRAEAGALRRVSSVPARPDPAAPAAQMRPAVEAVPSREPVARRSQQVRLNVSQLAADGYVTPAAPRSQLADEFRVIKRPLLMNALGKSAAPVERANLIMVTSAVPGEGKTFTAINLAMSLASELDTTALLVDADVSRPAVLSRLGLRVSRGLLDLLTDPALEVSDVLLRTSFEKLSILPAGTPHSHATELLASEAMSRLLEELANRYSDRILVFDTPPLLPSTESRVLATHMGQVVLVIGAESTPQGTVQQALATIEACPVVMTVLNRLPRSEVGAYYGYYGSGE